MTKNMGKTDRVIRAVIGALLLIMALGGMITAGWLYWVALIVGIVMLVTAAIGNCPAYSIFGIRTCAR